MIKVNELRKVEKRMFYDSTWTIDTNQGCIERLTRDDSETYDNLKELIERCNNIEEVKNLDMRNKIYYD
jgi:hypothetical protein